MAGSAAARRLSPRARQALGVAMVAGMLVRFCLLPFSGTSDVSAWETWAYRTATAGVLNIYTLQQDTVPPVSVDTIRQALTGQLPAGLVHYQTWAYYTEYPPATYYLLGLVGTSYRQWVSPSFAEGPILRAFIKFPILLAELLITLLLFATIRRQGGVDAGLIAAAAYWLNPLVLLSGTLLGYLDAWYGPSLVLAGSALLYGRYRGLWAGWAGALIFKSQPLVLLPALLTLSARRGPWRLLGYGLTAAAILLAVTLPYLLTDHTLPMLASIAASANQGFISAYQVNLWWLFSYLVLALHAGDWQVTTILLLRPPAGSLVGNLSFWGLVLFGGFTVLLTLNWVWRTRAAARRAAAAGSTAPGPTAETLLLPVLQFYGATMLLTGVHENHLLGILPLLGLAAGWAMSTHSPHSGRYWRFYALLSLIIGGNLLLFYGLGADLPNPLPRTWFGLDSSILLTVFNIAVFFRFSRAWLRGEFAAPAPALPPVRPVAPPAPAPLVPDGPVPAE